MLGPRDDADHLVYRRFIRLRAEPSRVFAEVEDNPHHFQVTLHHDGERVQSLETAAPRHPWTSCPGAGEPLQRLVGMALSPRATAVGAVTDARAQCTHLFDLAGLAIAHAHAHATQGRERRDYACSVGADRASGHTVAELARDGAPLLRWRIDGEVILEPPQYAGVRLHARFMAWAEANLDLEQAEAALVLRRACFVAPSRFFDLDTVERATELNNMLGRCHTFSDGVVETALRVRGSHLDELAEPDPAEPGPSPPRR